MRTLRSQNKASSTQRISSTAAFELIDFLDSACRLRAPEALTKRDLEAFMEHMTATRSASTANVTYRALQQWFRWMIDEEIPASPMARMHPPKRGGRAATWTWRGLAGPRRRFCRRGPAYRDGWSARRAVLPHGPGPGGPGHDTQRHRRHVRQHVDLLRPGELRRTGRASRRHHLRRPP
ncbi:MAG: phage integrase N-terminal SAM-like domain-containing protein, partial [Nocardioidaceae bacterium]